MTVMSDYFQHVVTLTPDTYFSVHRIKPGAGGAPGMAYQDFVPAEKIARDWAGQGFNVYLAMGAQQTCKSNGVAIRKKKNTVAARCLYMDIDVKRETYASTQEAEKAFDDFKNWANLPLPTVTVKSGSGGFHVYWTLSELITPDEHHKLSDQLSSAAREFGLKFDSNCTADLVRLFRVPDTFNFKYSSALPVEMLPPKDVIDIDFMRGILGRFARPTPKSNTKTGSDNDDLRGGATYRSALIDQVAELCPFIKETLAKGGSNLEGEPQWHAMAALSCHCVAPSATVHRLCEKNEHYDYASTEKKLAQTQEYRKQDSTLGPPLCATLRSIGAPHCATCPHLSLDTTPLALPFLINGYPSINDLPSGYFRDDRDHIYIEEREEKDDKPERVVVFDYPLYPNSGYLEDGKPGKLNFMTLSGEQKIGVSIETTAFTNKDRFSGAFLGELLPIRYHVLKSRIFFMDYIHLLQSKKETTVRIPPLGWEQQSDGVWGFAYDGEFVTPKGKRPCKQPGRGLKDYKVVGTEKIWRDIAQMVLTKDRPDLMVLVASAFSAPLVRMSGQNGYLIGAWSSASGIGKTTALLLAQSVWAYPALGGFSDTVNYTFDKCASIQDLPVIYDEVKGDHVKNFVDIVFAMTGGREKGRSDRSGHMRETRTWHTNICYATNESIVSVVADQTQGTPASVYRIFEFEALNLPFPNPTSVIAKLMTQLGFNYGGIGKIYAEYLGQHHEKIRKDLLEFQAKLEQALSAQSAERCWIAAMSTTLYGAFLAERLGLAPFDIPLMKKFMLHEFNRMRHDQRISDKDYTNPNAIYNELGTFMNENGSNTIITDRAWTTVGRPPPNYARIIRHPSPGQELAIQVSGDPLTIRIRVSFLGRWCKKSNRHLASLLTAIAKIPKAIKNKSRLASGTSQATSLDMVISIPIVGTPLEGEYTVHFKDLKP